MINHSKLVYLIKFIYLFNSNVSFISYIIRYIYIIKAVRSVH